MGKIPIRNGWIAVAVITVMAELELVAPVVIEFLVAALAQNGVRRRHEIIESIAFGDSQALV